MSSHGAGLQDSSEQRPLEGFRVVELAQMIAGPSAALLLADYGADVLKLEPPSGDTCRKLRSAAAASMAESPVFVGYNRGKRIAQLDIRTEAGREQVFRLIEEADVFIESARPGVMERLGLGADTLLARNPRLVYASVSGFGRGEIGAKLGGVDMVVQAESGMMSTTGFPGQPATKVGFTVVDAACGHALCHGILASLLRRERTGRGEVVRVSLYDVALHLQTGPIVEYLMTGVQPERSGNSAPLSAPADSFRCADGEVVISAYIDAHWQKFVALIEAPELLEDPRFLTGPLKVLNRAALTAMIEKRLAARGAAEWVSLLQAHGLLAGLVKDYAAVTNEKLTQEVGAIQSTTDGFGIRNPIVLEKTVLRTMQGRTELSGLDALTGFTKTGQSHPPWTSGAAP
ncbi:CaiB/BaiF CoA-transferase family protein [Acidovorax sp. Leaf73]|uniref:CaiB/BaiF CoA transferase family protein n=1 Tax=Acidovorax sp. Leaf73 TaxID=2876566 RepID=UPI00210316FD|nr:CoA transferase [Acidovorax sp. Leaf73]